ncbi:MULTISPECIES: hypothetical protein [unclassified Shewanella]|jgi:hypothetical protein|uniref:hypothetical protein n=1 Tax=unclassified Shewanella TaxID=196818 RepID=UPI00332EEA9B|tara:strand:+ start:165 stop:668 length:504 start_codon:yes stop_codon:yes gene_type:complete
MNAKQDAIDILNGFIVDISVAVEVLKDYEVGDYPQRDNQFRQGLYRLCLQSIILNCAKYTEFCREYGQVLNECCPDLSSERNNIKENLEQRGVNKFRSKYIAHNRCDITKRPFTTKETDMLVNSIIGGSGALDFLNWLLPDYPENVKTQKYFTGFLSLLRDRIHETL